MPDALSDTDPRSEYIRGTRDSRGRDVLDGALCRCLTLETNYTDANFSDDGTSRYVFEMPALRGKDTDDAAMPSPAINYRGEAMTIDAACLSPFPPPETQYYLLVETLDGCRASQADTNST